MSVRQLRGFQVPPLSTEKINRIAINCRKGYLESMKMNQLTFWI
jgi:hypothetical protein